MNNFLIQTFWLGQSGLLTPEIVAEQGASTPAPWRFFGGLLGAVRGRGRARGNRG